MMRVKLSVSVKSSIEGLIWRSSLRSTRTTTRVFAVWAKEIVSLGTKATGMYKTEYLISNLKVLKKMLIYIGRLASVVFKFLVRTFGDEICPGVWGATLS